MALFFRTRKYALPSTANVAWLWWNASLIDTIFAIIALKNRKPKPPEPAAAA